MPIFGRRPAPPPVPGLRPTNPSASNLVIDNKPVPAMSGFGALSAGEGRAMANRNPAPTMPGKTTLASGQVVPTAQYNALRKLGGLGMKKGGKVSSASKRADGCAVKGKTKGRIV